MHSLSRNIKIQTISAFVKARMAHKQNEPIQNIKIFLLQLPDLLNLIYIIVVENFENMYTLFLIDCVIFYVNNFIVLIF